jgi:hypothetical protein
MIMTAMNHRAHALTGNTDLPVLTVQELNRVYHELVERLADYDGIHADALHIRLGLTLVELYKRAQREDAERALIDIECQPPCRHCDPKADRGHTETVGSYLPFKGVTSRRP